MEDKKVNEGSGSEGCCSTSGGGKSCCCCKKVIVSIILGLLLFGAGYYVGKGGCGTKMCPMMQTQQMPMQK